MQEQTKTKPKKKQYETQDRSSEFSPPKKPKTYDTMKTGEKGMFVAEQGGKPKEYEVVNRGRKQIPAAGVSPASQGFSFEDQLIYEYQKAEEYKNNLKFMPEVKESKNLPKSGEVFFDFDGQWKRAGKGRVVDGKTYYDRDEVLDKNQLAKENPLVDWDSVKERNLSKAMYEAGVAYDESIGNEYTLADQFSPEGESVFGDKRRSIDAINEKLPFVGAAFNITKMLQDREWQKRIEDGKGTVEDYKKWGVLQKRLEREHGKDWHLKAIDIFSQAPAFMVELGATGGMSSLAKGGVLKGVAEIGKRAPVTALKMPQRVAESAVRESMADPMTMQGRSDDLGQNIIKGYIDQTIEVASEMSGGLMGTGGMLGKGLSKAGQALDRIAPEKLSSLVKSAFAKIPRDATVDNQLLKKMRQMGFNGTIEEYLEERVGEVLRGSTSFLPFESTDLETGFGTTGDIAKAVTGDRLALESAMEQTFAELTAFGAMSGGRRALGTGIAALKAMQQTPSRREWAKTFLGNEELFEQAPSRRERYRQWKTAQDMPVGEDGVPIVDPAVIGDDGVQIVQPTLVPESERESPLDENLTPEEQQQVDDWEARNQEGMEDDEQAPVDVSDEEVAVEQDVPEVQPTVVEDEDVPEVQPTVVEDDVSPEDQYLIDRDDMINTLNSFPKDSVLYQENKISPREPASIDEQEVADFLDSIGQPFSFVDGGNFRGIRRKGFMLLNNEDDSFDLWQAVGHELAHTQGFDEIIPAGSKQLEEAKQKYWDVSFPQLKEQLRRDPDRWDREARANIVGEFIRDKAFRDKIQQENPTMFDRLLDFIVELMGDFAPTSKAKKIVLDQLREQKAATEFSNEFDEEKRKEAEQFDKEYEAGEEATPEVEPELSDEERERKAFEEAFGDEVEDDEEVEQEAEAEQEPEVEQEATTDAEAEPELTDEERERRAFEEAFGDEVEDDDEVEEKPKPKSTGEKPKPAEPVVQPTEPTAKPAKASYEPSTKEIEEFVTKDYPPNKKESFKNDKFYAERIKKGRQALKQIKFFEEKVYPKLAGATEENDFAIKFKTLSHTWRPTGNGFVDATNRSVPTLRGSAAEIAEKLLKDARVADGLNPKRKAEFIKTFEIGKGFGSVKTDFKADPEKTEEIQNLFKEMLDIDGELKSPAKPKSTGKKPKPAAEKPKPKPKSTGEKPAKPKTPPPLKPKTDLDKAADDILDEFDFLPSQMSQPEKPEKPERKKVTRKQLGALSKFFAIAMDQTGNDVAEAIRLLDEKTRSEEKGSFVAAYRDVLTKAVTKFVEIRRQRDPSIKLPNLVKVMNRYEKEDPLVKKFADRLRAGDKYRDIKEARKEAESIIGEEVKAGTVAVKEVDEAMERAVVLVSREIAASNESDDAKYDRLVDLYDRHPVLGSRTSTSSKLQMFSTPAPLAFIASRAAKVKAGESVYDSAAGNGMLLIEADLDKAFANEIDEDRNRSLEQLGVGTVTQQDANEIVKAKRADKIIINPPFGKDPDNPNKSWTVDGVTTMERDHSIALKTLQSLQPDGKAVVIIGAKGFKHFGNDNQRSKSYRNIKFRDFYDKIYDKYNVTDHYTVGGDLYRKQGTSYPVDVIVIDGIGQSKRPKPYNVLKNGVPELIKDWETLKNEKLNKTPKLAVQGQGTGVESTQPQSDSDSGGSTGVVGTTRTGGVSESDEGTPPVDGGTGAESGTDARGESVREDGDGDRPAQEGVGTGVSGQVDETDADRGRGTGDRGVADEGAQQAGTSRGRKGDGTKKLDAESNRELEETEFQKTYTVTSRAPLSLGTLVPTNHVAAIKAAMEAIEAEHGQVDEFVARELKYTVKQLHKYLAAEQVDAVAMAIHNHKNGSAFIIGDQTGIGKGRVVASMIRFAKLQGFVPVFVTQKPTLYDDMLRDLMDIGMNGEDNPFEFFATNAATGREAINLKQDGKGRFVRGAGVDKRRQLTELVNNSVAGDGLFFSSPTKEDENAVTNVDGIFTTYAQLTPKKSDKFRLEKFKKLAKNAYFILDESHEAGALTDIRSKDGEPEVNLALGVRLLLEDAAGAFYSSATFAKRPALLDLYFKTDIRKAVKDLKDLTSMIISGGVPFQQVISEMLVEAGQYIRRERSYAGINFGIKKAKANRSHLDEFSMYVRELNDFSILTKEARDNFEPSVTSIGGTMYPNINTDSVSLSSLTFGSLMHNLVDAAMFGMKAEHAAQEAIAALKRGEQPVIAVDNTMGSILNTFLELNPEVTWGDEVDFNFKTLLNRFLEESKRVTVRFKEEGSDVERTQRVPVPEEMFSAEAKEQEKKLRKLIKDWNLPIPASPIDYIRSRIEQAGYSVKEITGRDKKVVYPKPRFFVKGDKVVSPKLTLEKRDSKLDESADTIKEEFNSGKLDAVILNRAGSTGISLHASAKNPVEGQKPRHMIIAQADKNVDKFVQMLGRIHRTGQVKLPAFTLLMLDAPAETRPATNLVRKLASLNANVTGGAKGAISFDAPDIFNSVGDDIVMNYMENNRHMNTVMGNYLNVDDSGRLVPRKAHEITGKAILMPLSMQEEFWDEITREYIQTINDLTNRGMNPFTADALDLQAKVLERVEIAEGNDESDNPFEQAAFLDTVDVLLMGKPMSSKQVQEKVDSYYEVPENSVEATRAKMAELADAHKLVRPEGITDSAWETRLATTDRQLNRVDGMMRMFPVGRQVTFKDTLQNYHGVIIGLEHIRPKKEGGASPVAPSRWVYTIAVQDSLRTIKVPMSKHEDLDYYAGLDMRQFDMAAQGATREKRYIVTGNLVKGKEEVKDDHGRVVFFTKERPAGKVVTGRKGRKFVVPGEMETSRGILMPREWSPVRWAERKPVVLRKGDAALAMEMLKQGIDLVTIDGLLEVKRKPPYEDADSYKPRLVARKKGRKYWKAQRILQTLEGDTPQERQFVSSGKYLKATGSGEATLEAILQLDILQVNGDKSKARRIIEQSKSKGDEPSAMKAPRTAEGRTKGKKDRPMEKYARQSRDYGQDDRDLTKTIAADDIIKTLNTFFKATVFAGRIKSKDVLGWYNFIQQKPNSPDAPEIIRLKEKTLNNLAVYIHELAHHLDQIFKFTTNKGSAGLIPKDVLEEIRYLDYDNIVLVERMDGTTEMQYGNKQGRATEGWAEFFRIYITEPNTTVMDEQGYPIVVPVVQTLAPKMVEWFENELPKLRPELWEQIKKAREYSQDFARQSVWQRVSTMIGNRMPRDVKWTEEWKDRQRRRAARAKRYWIDQFHALFDVQARAKEKGYEGVGIYDASMAYYMTASSAAAVAFEEGVRGLAQDEQIGTQSLWGLRDYLANDQEYDQAIMYAYARHALFMLKKNPEYETGIDIDDAKQIIEQTKDSDPEQAKRFEKFSRGLAQFGNDLLLMQARAGVISMAEAQTIIDYYGGLNYFPLHRASEKRSGLARLLGLPAKIDGTFLGTQAGIVNLPAPIRGRSKSGSTRRIIDPVDAMVAKTFKAYQQAIQARMITHLVKTVDPKLGGVTGMGGLMDRVTEKTKVTTEQIGNMIKQLKRLNLINDADVEAMEIAAKIRMGEFVYLTPIEKMLFAKRHQNYLISNGLTWETATESDYLEMAKKEPNPEALIAIYKPDFSPDQQKRIVRVSLPSHSARPIMYQVDDFLYETITGMSEAELEVFGRVMLGAARVFKTGAVGISTVFGANNLIRDIQEGFAKQKHTKGTLNSLTAPFVAIGKYLAVKALAKGGFAETADSETKKRLAEFFKQKNLTADNPMTRLYEQTGSKLYSRIGFDIDSQSRARKNKLGGFGHSKFGITGKIAKNTGKGVVAAYQGVQDWMAVTDAPVRLAEGEAAIAEDGFVIKGNRWFNVDSQSYVEKLPEETRIKAAIAMAEASINFKRIGTGGRRIETFMPFFNATIQSQYRQYMQLKSASRVAKQIATGQEFDEQEATQAKKLMVYYAALVAAEALFYFMVADGDDDREKDPYLREQYWSWGKNGKTYWRVPKPRDAAVITNVTRLMLDSRYGDPKEREEVGEVLLREFWSRMPTGGGGVRGSVEVFADYDYFRDAPLTPLSVQDEPAALQRSDYTTRTSDAIGMVTGKYLGLSPIQMQHLLNSATGGQYRAQTERIDRLMDGNLSFRDLPFARAFAIDRMGGRSVTKFYDKRKSILEAKSYEKENFPKDQARLSDELIKELALSDFVYNTMSEIRKLETRRGKKRSKEYQKYIIGLARRDLGYDELVAYPDPVKAKNMPKPMQNYMDKVKQNKVNTATETLGNQEDYTEEQWYNRRKDHLRAVAVMKNLVPTYAEAEELLYKQREATNMSRSTFFDHRNELKRLYGKQ